MARNLSLDQLWNSTLTNEHILQSNKIAALPDAARHYLEHAIAPGTQLASAVRLRMHGQIKLKQWLPFSAEQVISQQRGMIWRARVRLNGLIISGFDRYLNGHAAMRWKLFGIIPVMHACGPDIDRSAAGRFMAESVWLPSTLCANNISWTVHNRQDAKACSVVGTETQELSLAINEKGQLKSLSLPRWGNPEGGPFHYASFGGIVEEERTFTGYTIPTRLRIGWSFETDRFENGGEFFRVTIDEAVFR